MGGHDTCAEASACAAAQARSYQNDGTRRACSKSVLLALAFVLPQICHGGRAELGERMYRSAGTGWRRMALPSLSISTNWSQHPLLVRNDRVRKHWLGRQVG